MTGASPAEPALIAADDCPRPPQSAAEHRPASVSPYATERSNSEQLMRRDFDPHVPNVARIYNWLLGGKDNFAADRRAAAKLLDAVPQAAVAARENRAFLHRAVRFLANEAGIRQFVDIGAGLPTARAVHEIIHGLVPPPVVVYADNDPVVIRHAEALIGGAPGAAAIQADLRQPKTLLDLAARSNLIDLAQPVAMLLVAVLHFLEDSDDPWAIVNRYKDQMAPGSFLVISHVTADRIPAGAARQAREAYANASAPGVPRTRAQVLEFFGGLDMVRPGLVNVSAWRPGEGTMIAGPALFYAGIGRKTAPGTAAMRHAPGIGSQPASETSAEAGCWREAARLRREHRGWIVIWLARDNCYRAYRRTPGARRDTALSAPTARDIAKRISQSDKAAARRARRAADRA